MRPTEREGEMNDPGADAAAESWPPEIAQAFADLPRETSAPRELERRVVAALGAAGLLRHRPRGGRFSRWGLAAAAIVGLVVGVGAGSSLRVPPLSPMPAPMSPMTPASTGQLWLLLLYEDAGYDTPAAADLPARVAEYSAWAGSLAERGALESAGELAPGGRLLSPRAGGPGAQTRSPASEAGEVTGFFLLRAGSEGEAQALAEECPHLKHGGRIALRGVVSG